MESRVIRSGGLSRDLKHGSISRGTERDDMKDLTRMIRSKPERNKSEWKVCADSSCDLGNPKSAAALATAFSNRR